MRKQISQVLNKVIRHIPQRERYVILKLTQFHGRHTVHISGVRDAQIKTAVSGGVSSTNH